MLEVGLLLFHEVHVARPVACDAICRIQEKYVTTGYSKTLELRVWGRSAEFKINHDNGTHESPKCMQQT